MRTLNTAIVIALTAITTSVGAAEDADQVSSAVDRIDDAPMAFEVAAAAVPIPKPNDSSPTPTLVRSRPRIIAADRSPAVAVLTHPAKYKIVRPGNTRTHFKTASVRTSTDAVEPPRVDSGTESDRTDDSESVNALESIDARDTMPPNVEEALATRGSVTFRKTPLAEVVFLLSDLWRINIVAGDNVTGEVSGTFHDTPLSEVLTAVLSSSGYSYRKTGSSLIVLSADQVGADDANFVSETIRIPPQLQEGEQALEAARLLLSDRGKINRIGSQMILVIDSEERINRVKSLFGDFGGAGIDGEIGSDASNSDQTVLTNLGNPTAQRSGIAYFTPQFTDAETMAEPLQSALGDSVIVAVFPEENRILVKGTPQDLEIASEAIEQLDRARPQVRITATIYDVSLREVERLGINWNFSPHSGGTALTDIADDESIRFRNLVSASTSLVTDPAATGAGNLAISTINDTMNVDALLQALSNNSEAKLLADPSVTVGDRREASIRIVQKIPIIAADPVDSSGVVFSQVQFEEAGIILNVQPRISRDGTIDMQVKPEYSVVSDFIQNNPVIDSRTAETTVRVGNGHTFVIGGLRQKSVIESVRGVPFLKDVKFIGKWFRSHDTEIQESELIVFLKPELITPHYFGRPREQEASRIINHELDAIPHAQICPMTPCCNDPNCPNHHPRIKVNGGSEALKWNEFGEVHSDGYADPQIQQIRIVDPETAANTTVDTTAIQPRSIAPMELIEESELPAPAVVHPRVEAEATFPPVHIDPRVQ